MTGTTTTNLPPSPLIDELVANRDGTSVRQAVGDLALQLAADGPIADALTSGLLLKPLWSELGVLTGSEDGVGGEVLESDAGAHNQATATGYDGVLVNNAGRYSWNETWQRWVRIGDNGLSLKAPKANPTFTGAVSGVTKAHVGLPDLNNERASGITVAPLGVATGAGVDYVVATASAAALEADAVVLFTPNVDNTASPTLKVGTEAALPIRLSHGGAVSPGHLVGGAQYLLSKVSANWRIVAKPFTGGAVYRALISAGSPSAYEVTLQAASIANLETFVVWVANETCEAAPTMALDGRDPVQMVDRQGKPLAAKSLREGHRYILQYATTAIYVLNVDGIDADAQDLAVAVSARKFETMRNRPLGEPRFPVVMKSDTWRKWVASYADTERMILTQAESEIDLREAPFGAPITVHLNAAHDVKLITTAGQYTATGPQIVRATRTGTAEWVFEGAVTQEADFLAAPAVRDYTYIAAGQSLAERFLTGGSGAAGLHAGMQAFNNSFASFWPIEGAVGGAGLVAASNPVNYLWDVAADGPGPAALAWKAALEAKPANQPAPSFIYLVLGQTDGPVFGTHPDLQHASYKATLEAYIAWMRTEIGDFNCPVIMPVLGSNDFARSSVNDPRSTALRKAQFAVIADDPNIHQGSDYWDLDRPMNDPHLSPSGTALQGFRLAGDFLKHVLGVPVDTGPTLRSVTEFFGGSMYRLIIDTPVGGLTLPVYPDLVAFLPNGDPLNDVPVGIKNVRVVGDTTTTKTVDFFLEDTVPGATFCYPYGGAKEYVAGRYYCTEQPVGVPGNYPSFPSAFTTAF